MRTEMIKPFLAVLILLLPCEVLIAETIREHFATALRAKSAGIQGKKLTEPLSTLAQPSEQSFIKSIGNDTLDKVKEKVAAAVTGSAAGGASTSKLDFLPDLIVELPDLVDGVVINGEDPTSESIDLLWNMPFCPGANAGRCLQISLSGQRDPQVSEALLEAVDVSMREEAKAQFGDELNVSDDFSFGLRYSFNGRIGGMRFGRNIEQYMPYIRTLHQQIYFQYYRNDQLIRFRDYLASALQNNPLFTNLSGFDTPKDFVDGKTYSELEDAQKAELNRLYADFYQAETTQMEAEAIDRSYSLLDLLEKGVDNQPQLIVEGKVTKRDSRVGADSNSLSVRLEIPLERRVDAIIGALSRDCITPSEICVQNIDQAVQDAAKQQGWRASFALDWIQTKRSRVINSDLMLDFATQSVDSLVVSGSISRRLEAIGRSGESEITLAVSYQDVDDDPMRNDRATASLSWAFKYGDAAVPISLIYANKPEFDLMDTDSQLSATIGIKYDLEGLFGRAAE